ncbi:NADH ubiquinone oxidoreductase chain A [hydrothermal vent metagenome]|uniref:NADH ubiquinone oxidoreductase chain A n=1 Tax=hydrothermal vent metagenome TaxID=652676 RepID=A0A3B0RD36_9ZZZZ
MLLTYVPVLFMTGFITVMAVGVLFVSSLVRPKNPYAEKLTSWECGIDSKGESNTGHYKVHFFVIAILFILFDVETLFLFPWAVILGDPTISTLAFIEMFVFIGILSVGLIYAWGKGALEWL